MLFLKSSGLTVSVLDPKGDQEKFGSRYCVGGYIWQVDDEEKGPITAGPCFPGPTNRFDGQGLPEAFEIALGQDKAVLDSEVTVIGVGKVPRKSPIIPFHVRDNLDVSLFDPWEVEILPSDIYFRTTQWHGEYGLQLTRRISLQERTLISSTTIENLAASRLPIRWFAHPFFPWAKQKVFRFSVDARLPANQHWEMNDDLWVCRKIGAAWGNGSSFLPLVLPFGFPIHVEQAHPTRGQIRIDCNFPLAHLPIWGNEKTVSFEPYFHTIVEPAERTEWSIAYHL